MWSAAAEYAAKKKEKLNPDDANEGGYTAGRERDLRLRGRRARCGAWRLAPRLGMSPGENGEQKNAMDHMLQAGMKKVPFDFS